MPREAHQSKHRFDATITNPRRSERKARARCSCSWSGEVLRPLADARCEWDEHVAKAKEEERR